MRACVEDDGRPDAKTVGFGIDEKASGRALDEARGSDNDENAMTAAIKRSRPMLQGREIGPWMEGWMDGCASTSQNKCALVGVKRVLDCFLAAAGNVVVVVVSEGVRREGGGLQRVRSRDGAWARRGCFSRRRAAARRDMTRCMDACVVARSPRLHEDRIGSTRTG